MFFSIYISYFICWLCFKFANKKQGQSTKMRRKYFQYYSALQAKSSNCKRYSRASLSLGADGRAYECRANGNYITEDVLALGKPW